MTLSTELDLDPDQLDGIARQKQIGRDILQEVMDANSISTSISPIETLRVRRDLIAQELLERHPSDTIISRELYDADSLFGECLCWMNRVFEFPNWEGRTVGHFLAAYSTDMGADMNVLQHFNPRYNKDGVLGSNVTLQELRDATPLGDDEWLLPNGVEIRFF